MKVVHVLNNRAIEKDVSDAEELSFFLSGSNGGFAHFSTAQEPTSRYQGFFAKIDSNLFKAVESIIPAVNERIVAVESTGYSALFHHSTFYESFFMPSQRNCLVYQLSRELPVGLFLDVRLANDLRQWGRYYNAGERGNAAVISFTKKTDSREDSSNGKEEFSLYVAVVHDGFVSNQSGEWVRRSYSLDAKRNSASERYVYKAVAITAKTFVVSVAASAAAAIKEASSVFGSIERLKRESKVHYASLCGSNSDELSLALNAAKIALDKLRADGWLYAGLPWFFQEWSRDELISCAALPTAEKKRIALSYLDKALDDGRLPNRIRGNYEGSPLTATAADGIGWLFKRASELFEEKKLTAAEVKRVKLALKKSIDGLLRSHHKNGFITNDKNETWMDTEFNDDGRTGVCIEIQAMQLQMYSLMHKLSMDRTYLLLEKSLKKNVREFFWNGAVLADRLNDFTIRPNIFIAAYVYPHLLAKKEWEICIQAALNKLWLDWGGLATIDKNHRSFRNEYTGETNESYHRGDSWFWLNSLAAIVMSKVNSRKFRHCIEKIAEASATDILWKGAVGCASELSSAKEQRAEGCLNQAWSNATFVELAKLLSK